MFKLLKRASTHYRFLLYLICSSSFKNYFDVIANLPGETVLPDRGHINSYDFFFRRFEPKMDMEQIGEVVDAEVEAEVEADGQLEDEAIDEAPFEGVSKTSYFVEAMLIIV